MSKAQDVLDLLEVSKKMLDTKSYKLFSSSKEAEKIAKQNQKDDPDWKYVVKKDSKKKGFFIEVSDEDGEILGKL